MITNIKDERIEAEVIIPEKTIQTKVYYKTTNFHISCKNLMDYNVKITREKITTEIDCDDNEVVLKSEEFETIFESLNDLLKKYPDFLEIYKNIDNLLDKQVYTKEID